MLLHAYSEARSSAAGRAELLIRAEPGPFKVKPESPGGRRVRDRDKKIYDRIGAVPAGEPVERLLPEPEVPLPPEKVLAAKTDPPPAEAMPAVPAPNAPAETEAKPAPPKAAPAQAPPAPAVQRKYRLQLAALRSRAAARKAWNRLRSQNRKLLGERELEIERKDLGPPKGVYYRLLVGPATDRESARLLCAALAKRKVGCLVVQR
ncbi:MAG: SPOR domain-containing protein [Defluviicoccus sp.]|nr:SPOR domain-containing protein [Defluviicoccus sp.]MDE0383493.1 SPOR domain-containing protein [Defluviicoccus sp.]